MTLAMLRAFHPNFTLLLCLPALLGWLPDSFLTSGTPEDALSCSFHRELGLVWMHFRWELFISPFPLGLSLWELKAVLLYRVPVAYVPNGVPNLAGQPLPLGCSKVAQQQPARERSRVFSLQLIWSWYMDSNSCYRLKCTLSVWVSRGTGASMSHASTSEDLLSGSSAS